MNEDSNLQIIEPNAFFDSGIEEINLPASLKELKEGWCCGTKKLNKITISPSNGQFMIKDDKYLIGKSDSSKDEFDLLLFAKRDINEISIPSNIKVISSYAFQYCYGLKKVEISLNSNLQIIESESFTYTKIKKILISSKITKICNHAFSFCESLEKVEIPSNSDLQIIESFAQTRIKDFFVPSKVIKISRTAFTYCKSLQIVEISEESKLESSNLHSFAGCEQLIIMIPSSFQRKKDFLQNKIE